MLRKLLLLLIVLPVELCAQSVRYDSNVFTSATNVPAGAQAPIYTVPYSKITVCGYPATPTSAVCTNTVTIYSDSALSAPISQPLTADSQGRFGFWIPPGQYSYSVQTSAGTYSGNYPITLTGSFAPGGVANEVQANRGNGLLKGAGFLNSDVRTNTLPPLKAYLACVHAARTRGCDINVISDSRGIVTNDIARQTQTGALTLDIPYEDKWVTLLRNHLQALYGNGGPGMVPLRWAVGIGTPNPEYTYIGSATYDNHDVGPYQVNGSGTVTDAMLYHWANGSTVTWSNASPYVIGSVQCATTTASGSWGVSVDGVSYGTACPGNTSSTTAARFDTAPLPSTPHKMTVTCSGAGGCFLYALGGSNATGVRVNNLSLGSGSAETFGFAPSTQFAFADLEITPPVLSIVAHHTNESGQGISVATFQTSLANIYAHESGLGASSLFMAYGQDSISGQAPYYAALTAFMAANPVASLDIRTRWGQTLNPYYFGPDTIHENVPGNRETDAMVEAVLTDIPTPSNNLSANGASCSSGVAGYDYRGNPICNASGPVRACPTGYAYSETRTIPHGLVAENLVDFPVALYFNGISINSITDAAIKTVANGGQAQSSTGLDIVFCQNGFQLSHELVNGSYDPTTGKAEFYVKMSPSATVDTPFQVLIGNPNAVDTSRAADALSNGFAAVYHMGSTLTAAYYADSTACGNTLSTPAVGSATGGTGHLGNYLNLTISGDGGVASPSCLSSNSDARTVEGWFKLPATLSSYAQFLPGYGLYTAEGNFGPYLQSVSGVPGIYFQTPGTASRLTSWTPDTNWHFLSVALPPGGTAKDAIYNFDGASSTAVCPAGYPIACTGTVKTQPLQIHINGNNGLNPGAIALDEVRISNVFRSPGWTATTYTNLSNSAAFTPLTTSGAVTNAPYTGTCGPTTTLTVKGGSITGCIP